jgi:hypothetical protein
VAGGFQQFGRQGVGWHCHAQKKRLSTVILSVFFELADRNCHTTSHKSDHYLLLRPSLNYVPLLAFELYFGCQFWMFPSHILAFALSIL